MVLIALTAIVEQIHVSIQRDHYYEVECLVRMHWETDSFLEKESLIGSRSFHFASLFT